MSSNSAGVEAGFRGKSVHNIVFYRHDDTKVNPTPRAVHGGASGASGAAEAEEVVFLEALDRRAIRERRAVFGECFTHDAVDLDRPDLGLRWRWIVRDGWKLIVPAPWNEAAGQPELYRIRTDPLEQIGRAHV